LAGANESYTGKIGPSCTTGSSWQSRRLEVEYEEMSSTSYWYKSKEGGRSLQPRICQSPAPAAASCRNSTWGVVLDFARLLDAPNQTGL